MLSVRNNLNEENQNPSLAPTLGSTSGQLVGTGQGQQKNITGKGSGFTNLQSYIKANEPESGAGNINAQLVRKRADQAGQTQAQAQTGFEQKAGQNLSQLQGVQGIQNLVTGAANDPTKFVQEKQNVERIRNLATGKETFSDPNELLGQTQNEMRNLQTQRQNISQGLQTDVGAGLQDFLRSQRANPAMATAGENRLDRFITQSTPSGVSAIDQATQRANEIRALQTPEIMGQVEALRGQLNPELFSNEQISNYLTNAYNPEQQFLQGVGRNYLGQKIGLSDLGQAENLYNQYNQYKAQVEGLSGDELRTMQAIDRLNAERGIAAMAPSQIPGGEAALLTQNPVSPLPDVNPVAALGGGGGGSAPWAIVADALRQVQIQQGVDQLTGVLGDIRARRTSTEEQMAGIDQGTLSKYNQFLGERGMSRQATLQKYDPQRLARIQALAQISGNDPSQLLSGGLI